MKRKSIHVVAGIIYSRTREQILIARRPDHLHQGGLWEFPGGKVEAGEGSVEALVREIREELDINLSVSGLSFFREIHHDYPDKSVRLEFWQAHGFSGRPVAREGQTLSWVDLDKLADYDFPEANTPIIDMITATK